MEPGDGARCAPRGQPWVCNLISGLFILLFWGGASLCFGLWVFKAHMWVSVLLWQRCRASTRVQLAHRAAAVLLTCTVMPSGFTSVFLAVVSARTSPSVLHIIVSGNTHPVTTVFLVTPSGLSQTGIWKECLKYKLGWASKRNTNQERSARHFQIFINTGM